MDTSRNDQLGELAAEANLARTDFLAAASAQMDKFLDANRDRIAALGGLVLIDDEVDYLAIQGDLSFKSRSRYQDDAGKWVSEDEIITDTSELAEMYNLAEVYASFAEIDAETGEPEGEQPEADDAVAGQTAATGGVNPYAAAADEWAAAGHEDEEAPETEEEAAERLYDLALAFQERSQQTEAHLLEQFESAAAQLTSVLGDVIIVDDEDERLTLSASGSFSAEVVPDDDAEAGTWRKLGGAEAIVEFYDPTDIFGDLADALAEAFPGLGEPAGISDEDGREDGESNEDHEDQEPVEPVEPVEGDEHGEGGDAR
ncbi:MAG TPA: hypothetical protein VF375_06195 [Candidatus Limnocylindrales bacterium]